MSSQVPPDTGEPDGSPPGRMPGWRKVVPVIAAVAVIAIVAGSWFASLLPSAYSITSMGTVDTGGAPMPAHGHGGPPLSVTSLVADPDRPPDVVFDLTASQGPVTLPDGRRITGYALNGTSPGPTLEAVAGQLVEVHVHNQDVTDGMTIHWHGVDVPNADDGVAGVTQDAIPPGGDFVYRFVVHDAGTFWYHSHQVSHAQVLGGLFGALVVRPPNDPVADAVAAVHTYDGVRTINGRAGDATVAARPGELVRVRVIDTDSGAIPVWVSGGPFRVVAVDGRDVNEPGLVRGRSVLIAAGGRADLRVRVPPSGGVRVQVAGASLIIGEGPAPSLPAPDQQVDLLHYGVAAPTQVGFDPQSAIRHFRYEIGRRPGILDGKPGLWWTVNGRFYPDVPMFMVAEGDVVRFTITNTSGQVHPMHLHGHHLLVLARDGEPATGSPWWVDSLDVGNGETYDVALLADNPGIWMDHCHNLPHAAQGLTAHLMYEGVVTPFVIGGERDNHPE